MLERLIIKFKLIKIKVLMKWIAFAAGIKLIIKMN